MSFPNSQGISSGSAFNIRELTGDKRVVILNTRALPYRPFSLDTSQRVELEWLPGSPEATSTILGAKEEISSINGYWKDKYIDVSGAVATTAGFITGTGTGQTDSAKSDSAGYPIALNGRPVVTVLDAVDLFDSICRLGQICEVTWMTQKRHGYLTKFSKKFHNAHDLEWTMEWSWTSRGETPGPVVFQVGNNLGDTSQIMRAQFNGIDAISVNLPLTIPGVDTLTNLVNAIQDSVFNLEDAIQGMTETILDPIYTARGLLAICSGLKDECLDMVAYLNSYVVDAFTPDGPGSGTPNQKLQMAVWREQMRSWAKEQARLAVEQQNSILQQIMVQSSTVLATYQARGGQDLRDVSQQFYNTPFQWRQIMTFNGMTSAELVAGQIVFVPQLNLQGQTG